MGSSEKHRVITKTFIGRHGISHGFEFDGIAFVSFVIGVLTEPPRLSVSGRLGSYSQQIAGFLVDVAEVSMASFPVVLSLQLDTPHELLDHLFETFPAMF